MTQSKNREIDSFAAPFGPQVRLEEVPLEGAGSLLRLRIREGHRFTVLDLDPVTARRWATAMADWADSYFADRPEPGSSER